MEVMSLAETDVLRDVWRCRCIPCGQVVLMHARQLIDTKRRSCGCLLQGQRRFKPADKIARSHPLWVVWRAMKDRCYNRKHDSYVYYGARGIRVCRQWLHDSSVFIAWGQSHGWQPGLELDREDVNGNYSPGNCRFVTASENQRNKRNSLVACSRRRRKR